jgi:sulfonate transport system substrate-binding protein
MKRTRLLLAGVALAVTTSSVATAAAKKDTVYVPLNVWTAVALNKGWLQEEYAKVNTKVEAVDTSAMKIPGVEASLLEKGELHFVNCMGYVSIQHKLNGLDSVAVWGSKLPHPRRSTTIVLKDSPANKLADLKGKNLGGWRISCPYFATYEALKEHGVQQDTEYQKGDVRYTNIAPAAQVSALLGGKIDALSVHASGATISPLYTQGLVKELETVSTKSTYVNGAGRSIIFTLREFAEKSPEKVRPFIVAYERSQKWIKANPDAAAAIAARELRIPKHIAKFSIVDDSQLQFTEAERDRSKIIASYNLFQSWGIKNGDDFLKKKNLNQKQLEAFVDKRFFAGGQYEIK